MAASGISDNEVLRSLADKMPHYVIQSRSDNTVSTYFGGFKRWKIFAEQHNLNVLPAEPIHVALYLTQLLDSGVSNHVVNSAVYSIKWAHELNGEIDPTENSYVKALQEAAKRIASKKVCRKDPVTSDILVELCDIHKDTTDFEYLL